MSMHFSSKCEGCGQTVAVDGYKEFNDACEAHRKICKPLQDWVAKQGLARTTIRASKPSKRSRAKAE